MRILAIESYDYDVSSVLFFWLISLKHGIHNEYHHDANGKYFLFWRR